MKTFFEILRAFIPGALDEYCRIVGDISIAMAVLNLVIFYDLGQAKTYVWISFIAWSLGLLIWYVKDVLTKKRK
jgi:hypothetical protein